MRSGFSNFLTVSADSCSAVLDHLPGGSTSDVSRPRCYNSFGRGLWCQLITWACCARVYSPRVEPFEVLVASRNLQNAFSVNFPLCTVSITDLELGAFHTDN